MSIQHRPGRPSPWRARHYGLDGRERSRSLRRKIDAERFLAVQTADKVRDTWTAPEHARETVGMGLEVAGVGRALEAIEPGQGRRHTAGARAAPLV